MKFSNCAYDQHYDVQQLITLIRSTSHACEVNQNHPVLESCVQVYAMVYSYMRLAFLFILPLEATIKHRMLHKYFFVQYYV